MIARLASLAVLICLTACGETDDASEYTGDFLTVYGEINVANRGAVDAEIEPLFGAFDIDFQSAYVLPYGELKSLPQTRLEADFPAGGSLRVFSGPLLRDVLAIADVHSDTLRVTALDGYQREVPVALIQAHDVIFAIDIGGRPMSLGGLAPGMLVWPRRTDPALEGMSDDDWVWGVFALESFSAAPEPDPGPDAD